MGQNDSKEIETNVSFLESQKHISHSQAQKFLHDYHTNNQAVKDVMDFDSNRLKLFLKYFINHKYRATQTLLTKRTKTNQSANTNQNSFDQLIGNFCFETQKIQQKITRCHQDINSFILYEKLDMLEQIIKNTLSEIGINQLLMRINATGKPIKILFKKAENFLFIGQDNGLLLPNLLTHKYRFKKTSKQILIQQKFITAQDGLTSSEFFIEETTTKAKSVLLMISFIELNSINQQEIQIFKKIEKFSSAIGEFIHQILNLMKVYIEPNLQLNFETEGRNNVAEICWNVLKIHKICFDFQHFYFIQKLKREFNNLLNLEQIDATLKNIRLKIEEHFNKKKQKNNATKMQVIKSLEQYEKKYLTIKNSLSDYLQKYFRAINEETLQFEFDFNTEMKVLVSSGQSNRSHFLFNQIRQIVQKQATPTLLDVFKGFDSFQKLYKQSYQEALKSKKNNSDFQKDGIRLQFQLENNILQNVKISVNLQTFLIEMENKAQQIKQNNQSFKKQNKIRRNFLSIDLENEKENISQLSSTLNIKIVSKPSSPKKINIFDLTTNQCCLETDINIFDPELNVLNIPQEDHFALVLKILGNTKFYRQHLSTNQQKFLNFISYLRSGYQEHNNPFHNFTHAINVMHTTFMMVSMKQINEKLSEFSQFVLVFSALCHDVGHTGFNNAFQIASQSKLAQTYNDVSPLQNYHIFRTLQILKDSSCNFIDSLNNSQKSQFRKLLISNILNTDVKEHFNVLKKFDEKKNQFKNGDLQDEKILSGMLIHSSDFAGSIKEFSICYTWSQMVNDQFKNQSLQQSKLNLPLSPFMLNLDNPLILAKNQMGFLKFMVQPLYKSISEAFLNETSRKMFERVNQNISEWQKIIKSLSS